MIFKVSSRISDDISRSSAIIKSWSPAITIQFRFFVTACLISNVTDLASKSEKKQIINCPCDELDKKLCQPALELLSRRRPAAAAWSDAPLDAARKRRRAVAAMARVGIANSTRTLECYFVVRCVVLE